MGDALESARVEEICREGEKRYRELVPPGYKDSEKPGYRKYGDLLIWYELIDKARDSHLPLIFITSDAKEDWRVRHRGRTRGARPELIAEMRSKASVAFLLYSLESFLAAAKKYLDASITKKAIDEVKRSRKVATEPLPDVTAAVERYWQVVDQGRLAAEAARRHESLEEVRRAIFSAPSFQAMQREMEAAEAMRRTALSNPVIEAMQREMKVADETRRSTLSNPAVEAVQREMKVAEEMRRTALSNPAVEAVQREMAAAEKMRRAALNNPVIEAMQREMKIAEEGKGLR